MGELYRSGMANADLDKPLHRNVAGCLLATGDENGNRFGAFVNRGGQPVDLTGCTVTGYFIRPNMDTVVIEGRADVENSTAFVELPASCYAAAGVYSLAIKISLGGDTLTLCIFDGYIKQTQTGAVADPDEVIISVEQVLEKIAEMEAIAKDAKAAVASVAPAIEKTASGAVVTIADAAARPALSVVSEIRCLQLGGTEATPDNVKPIYHPLVQLYHGAAHDTAAEPVATANLPDAAFGGSYDWATGAVTVTQYQYAPKGADITSYGTASTGVPYVQLTLPEAWAGSGALCSHYRIVSGAPSSAAIRLVAPVGCYIYDPRFTDRATAAALLDAEKVQIVYDLQEAKAVQVEPVGLMLLKGSNAIWSGVGNTSVRYVVDTKTYVDAHSGGGGGGDPYVLPVASANTLGGVKVGEGLQVAEDGTVGVDVGQYELIETFTFAESMAFQRTEEPDGTPYKFSRMMLLCEAPEGEGNPGAVSALFPGTVDKLPIGDWSGSNTAKVAHYAEIYIQNGYWRCEWSTSTNMFVWVNKNLLGYQRIVNYNPRDRKYRYISGIRSTAPFRAGSVLKIYAIRDKGD